ncbi:DUF3662 and FHA domain-containing protein [Rothia nasimurium]|uniref:FhaA domain-containing protein n=1 Tax=Rothia nasimurium TaxID=85336 RepID=UPI0016288171|nr:DUF3662 and FHA domain-containing protein [Rothia nasimurium]
MGFIDRLEQGLEKAVRGTFSKGGTFEPVDIANRLRTEMDNKAFSVSSGRTIAPNNFTAEFSASDFSRAQQWGVPLAEELCDVVIRHARDQGYSLRGAVRVTFSLNNELEPGSFDITSAVKKMQAPQDEPAPHTAAAHPASAQQQLPTRITRPAAPPRTEPVPAHQLPQSRRPAPTPQVVLDINGERVVVRDLPVTLGRGSNADITVEDTGVSRRHLDIVEQDGTYLAVDLGSTNGSYLDGKRLHGRAELRNGSVIEMGRARIVFRLMVRKG